MPDTSVHTYPLLQGILSIRGLPLRPMYSNRDVAEIFDVSIRSIQDWSKCGRITPRDLPGRARFLRVDLEQFLTSSQRVGR
jgi:hypothetical protein